MAKTGEYSDVLRALGRFLDQQGARNVEVIDEGEFVRSSWQTGGGPRERRAYRAFELDRLRDEARLLRTTAGDGVPADDLAEALRTVGSELDRLQTELLSLHQTDDGIQVSTMDGNCHETHTFSLTEIKRLSLEQRGQRRAVPVQQEPAPTLAAAPAVERPSGWRRYVHR